MIPRGDDPPYPPTVIPLAVLESSVALELSVARESVGDCVVRRMMW